MGTEEEAAELKEQCCELVGGADQPIEYLSGVHHAPHSYVGVAVTSPSAVYYSGSGGKAPCCKSTDAAGLFCVVDGGGIRFWRSNHVVSLAKGAIPFQIVTRYPHRQHLLVNGYKS